MQRPYWWSFWENLPRFIMSLLSGSCLNQENGVQQGSSLSGLLFIITTNDIVKGIGTSIGKWLHVDDLDLFYPASSIAIIKCKLQRPVNKIREDAEIVGVHFFGSKDVVDL